jgi:hypothetical protein
LKSKEDGIFFVVDDLTGRLDEIAKQECKLRKATERPHAETASEALQPHFALFIDLNCLRSLKLPEN